GLLVSVGPGGRAGPRRSPDFRGAIGTRLQTRCRRCTVIDSSAAGSGRARATELLADYRAAGGASSSLPFPPAAGRGGEFSARPERALLFLPIPNPPPRPAALSTAPHRFPAPTPP